MNKLIIFTDGACINNGKQNAKAGYGIHFPNNELNDISEHFINSPITNQRAELYAILIALEKIKNISNNNNIELYTDSQYSIDCLTKWVKTWTRNGWKSKFNKPVKNQDIIKSIVNILNNYNISFHHVKAHTNKTDFISICNAKADKLATSGIHKQKIITNIDKQQIISYPLENINNKLDFDKLEKSIANTNKIFGIKESNVDCSKLNVNFDFGDMNNRSYGDMNEIKYYNKKKYSKNTIIDFNSDTDSKNTIKKKSFNFFEKKIYIH
jgi:ribonuclease HI